MPTEQIKPPICEQCNLNFTELNLTITEKILTKDPSENMLSLYCPFCKKETKINLKNYGIFYHQEPNIKERLLRWDSGTSKNPNQIALGNLIIEFPRDEMKVLTLESICYPAIPVFYEIDGEKKVKPSVPKLPIKKEALSFIDIEKQQNSNTEPELLLEQGLYRTSLFLKGKKDPVPITLPLIQTKTDQQAEEKKIGFRGVHLALWPDVDYEKWNRYFLRFGCEKDLKNQIDNTYTVEVFTMTQQEDNWVELDNFALDLYTRFCCVEKRPKWAVIEFKNRIRNEIVGGGIWRIEPATKAYNNGTISVAVDFGTSNTFIAWQKSNTTAASIPIDSCNKFIIHGSDIPTETDFPDTWPPHEGFGKDKALFPSEIILSRQPLDTPDSKTIEKWKPVINYGIPNATHEKDNFSKAERFSKAEHILAEFKWEESVSNLAYRSLYGNLQECYLEFLLLLALAQLAKKGHICRNVDVRFSYPLAFDKLQLSDFGQVVEKVLHRIEQQTGVYFTSLTRSGQGVVLSLDGNQSENPPFLSMDESRAAASLAGEIGSSYAACLYVDIGGGSTDIALLRITDEGRKKKYVMIDSVKYAGGALVNALYKGNCLIPDIKLTDFQHRIRQIGITELKKDTKVFQKEKDRLRDKKTDLFYGYLVEFLARILAVNMITWDKGPTEEDKRFIKDSGYQIAFYPLGNGWGFGQFITPTYVTETLSEQITKRLKTIMQDLVVEQVVTNIPEIQIIGQTNTKINNPKYAVGFGLLTYSDEKIDKEGEKWTSRTIVGCSTKVGNSRVIPWYRYVTQPPYKPEEEDRLDNSILDCPKNLPPIFPTDLPSPELLDNNLNTIRGYLKNDCIRPVHPWFFKSPFHILLEKLFKPKLEKLA